MATIPRTYLTTSKDNISNNVIPLKNGQVISVYDSDEVYYDAPIDGNPTGQPVRRKISGVRVITESGEGGLSDYLPVGTKLPMEGIVYVVIRPDTSTEQLPDNEGPLYDMRVWIGGVNGEWYVVGTNREDSNVKSVVSADRFYLTGSASSAETIGPLAKSNIYAIGNNIYANLKGNADTANDATNAVTAQNANKATNDKLNHDITSYLRDVVDTTVNNATKITFTLGDGTTTKTVQTINTQYDIFTSSKEGLVDKYGGVDPAKTDSTGVVLMGSGWIPAGNVSIGTADKAVHDQKNQTIDSTYIKDGSYDTTTEKLTLVYGDSTVGVPHTKEISIPDTTYSVFTSSTDGLVPAASATGAADMFLRGNGQWSGVFTVGSVGLVPAPTNNDTAKYLRGDHTWQDIPTFAGSTAGLVPTAQAADANKYLKGDGTWAEGNDTLNTAGSNQDAAKLYLVGAKSQTTGTNGVQTYSNANAYTQNGKLYSNNDEVVTLAGSQALTNKTYEGYTLAGSCARDVATTIAEIATDNFTGDGSTAAFTLTNTAQSIYDVYINGVLQATTAYSLNTSTNTVTFTSAPANDATIIIDYYDDAYDSTALTPAGAVASYLPNAIASAVSDAGLVDAGVIADIYDDSLSYSAGDYRTYQVPGSVYKLYCCNASTSGAFDPTKWDEVSVADILVRVPAPPTANGTYTLQVTVSGGVPTYGWV